MRIFTLLIFILLLATSKIQAQSYEGKKLVPDSANFANVLVRRVHTDANASVFAIWVKQEVKPHKHIHHSEVVTVLRGKGIMQVDGINRAIRKGDFVVIPQGTVHSVVTTSRKPLLVISVQSPEFDGSDRIWIE